MSEVYKSAGLSAEEIKKMPEYIEGTEEFYGSPAFEKLFEYFAFDGPISMPYGVAKARTGEPDVWILDYIEGEA